MKDDMGDYLEDRKIKDLVKKPPSSSASQLVCGSRRPLKRKLKCLTMMTMMTTRPMAMSPLWRMFQRRMLSQKQRKQKKIKEVSHEWDELNKQKPGPACAN